MLEDPKPHGKPILCLDFDGVIHSYKSGWQGVDKIPDAPVPGVFEWITRALQVFEIHVYSSRSADFAGRQAIIGYISEYGGTALADQLYYPTDKPRAFLTIDDRCMRFDGNWLDPQFDPKILREYKSWYQLQR